jgi:uncharacterized membrane protein
MAAQNQPQPVTWAQAVRDIVVASINKGQLLVFLCGIIFLAIVLRMPEKDVGRLAFEIVRRFKDISFVRILTLCCYAMLLVLARSIDAESAAQQAA